MKNIEKIKTPKGTISAYLHKGGKYNIETGKIEGGEVISEKQVKNLIVDKASILMACRMAPGQLITNREEFENSLTGQCLPDGLQYLAVGVGVLVNPGEPYHPQNNKVNTAVWDLQDPPAETAGKIALEGEIARKEFTEWRFLTSDGNTSPTPTNILKLVTTYNEGEAVGPLTEMGLFGGNASGDKNSGYMFNYKTFPVWN